MLRCCLLLLAAGCWLWAGARCARQMPQILVKTLMGRENHAQDAEACHLLAAACCCLPLLGCLCLLLAFGCCWLLPLAADC